MALSSLIQKSKSEHVATLTVATIATHDTEPTATVAKVASVTVANPNESKTTQVFVTCYTPLGSPILVEADNPDHADWLRRVNPPVTFNEVRS